MYRPARIPAPATCAPFLSRRREGRRFLPTILAPDPASLQYLEYSFFFFKFLPGATDWPRRGGYGYGSEIN